MEARTLRETLDRLIADDIRTPIFIGGGPGIGKSSIVGQVARDHDLEVIDLRLGQIPPSDLRGLPYVEEGISRYARPEFLPESGSGILFLDELSNAVPSVQGLAQQLLLERHIGTHRLGDDWFIWSAGNRREDGAAVHMMPTPVANRMIHFELEPSFDDWKPYAIGAGLHEDVLAFLSFRPELLYKLSRTERAFPTPRSWEMASALHRLGIPVHGAVGVGVADEFSVYVEMVASLPSLDPVLAGDGDKIPWPKEVSARYAVCTGLALRARAQDEVRRAFRWLEARAGAEWVQVYVADVVIGFHRRGELGLLAGPTQCDPKFRNFVQETCSAVLA